MIANAYGSWLDMAFEERGIEYIGYNSCLMMFCMAIELRHTYYFIKNYLSAPAPPQSLSNLPSHSDCVANIIVLPKHKHE